MSSPRAVAPARPAFSPAANVLLLAGTVVTSCADPSGPAGGGGSRGIESPRADFTARTVVTVDGSRFKVNGAVTYRGRPAEGLLMNVRMVNAVFEDTNRPEFNARQYQRVCGEDAKQRHAALPVSASPIRNGRTTSGVARASDLILVHFNALTVSAIANAVRTIRAAYPGKPIVCNEDAKTGSTAAAAASASVTAGASYGLMLERQNQHYPFDFEGRSDDRVAYDRMVVLTD